jgi:hypothetical protein
MIQNKPNNREYKQGSAEESLPGDTAVEIVKDWLRCI